MSFFKRNKTDHAQKENAHHLAQQQHPAGAGAGAGGGGAYGGVGSPTRDEGKGGRGVASPPSGQLGVVSPNQPGRIPSGPGPGPPPGQGMMSPQQSHQAQGAYAYGPPHPQNGHAPGPAPSGGAGPGGYGSLRGPQPPSGPGGGTQMQQQQQQQQQQGQAQGGAKQGQMQSLGKTSGGGMPSYPWSTRPLTLAPTTHPAGPAAVSPFPRYGLSLPPMPTTAGQLLIFGGLVREKTANDLYALDCNDFSTAQVMAVGELPSPRVGHASALVRSVLIVWGGDTKDQATDEQDEALYLFNIHTKEWTRIVPNTPSPKGRYGHAVCMQGSKFYILGGQADGLFMSDMWFFDLNSLIGAPTWERVGSANQPPPARTGHIMVSYGDMLYVFGGTDGSFHYNDTWQYDVATRMWTELQCIGYIPVPREGHAAALVDDVIYIFGGRDVNGKDLGDLAAFKITNRRWYMFQNMGPAPTGRSGHAMAAVGKQVLVLGGESNAAFVQPRQDDPSVVHVLDTGKIKYPPDHAKSPSQGQPPQQQIARKSSMPAMSGSALADAPQPLPRAAEDPGARQRTASLGRQSAPPTQVAASSGGRRSEDVQESPATRAMFPQQASLPPRSASSASLDRVIAPAGLGPPLNLAPISEGSAIPDEPSQPRQAPAPQRPRRQDDDAYGVSDRPRPFSPAESAEGGGSSVTHRTPTGTNEDYRARSSPNQAQFARAMSPPNGVPAGTSPRNRPGAGSTEGTERAPPADAFYYGTRSPVNGTFAGSRPLSGVGSGDVLRELKRKDSQLAAVQQREATLRAALHQAIQGGFVPSSNDRATIDSGIDVEQASAPSDIPGISSALLNLRQNNAMLRSELSEALRLADERHGEMDKQRSSALQEAAYHRARFAHLSAGATQDLSDLESGRLHDLEEELASLRDRYEQEHASSSRAESSLHTEQTLRREAEQRENEAIARAEAAEQALEEHQQELGGLRELHSTKDATLRDHAEKLLGLTSAVQQHEAERGQMRSQLDEVTSMRDDHLRLLEEAQGAVTAAASRADDLHDQLERSRGQTRQLEQEVAALKTELEAKSREAEDAMQRKLDAENAWTKSREEADSLRMVTTSRIGELLDSHKALRADENRLSRGHQEKTRALELESSSLRKMLGEAGARVDAAQATASHHRQQAEDLTRRHTGLQSELRQAKARLAESRQETLRFREMATTREADVRARDVQLTDLQARCATLRNILADAGVAVDDNNEQAATDSIARRLEAQLREQTEAAAKAQAQVDVLSRQVEDASSQHEDLKRQMSKIKQDRGMASASSPLIGSSSDDSRVAEMERRLADTEASHKKKVQQLESDYQTAVQYVKGTERVFRRLKDEVAKQKTLNATLQSELDALHGTNGTEAGARTRVASASGRGTPTMDVESSRQFQKLTQQHGDLQRRFEALQEEMGALRDVNAGREREGDIMRRRLADSDSQIRELRAELERVNSGNWEELEQENAELRQENENLTHRIGILLDVDDRQSEPDDRSARNSQQHRRSQSGGDSSLDNLSQEMHRWERTYSPRQEEPAQLPNGIHGKENVRPPPTERA